MIKRSTEQCARKSIHEGVRTYVKHCIHHSGDLPESHTFLPKMELCICNTKKNRCSLIQTVTTCRRHRTLPEGPV